jgi:hypothetical protein
MKRSLLIVVAMCIFSLVYSGSYAQSANDLIKKSAVRHYQSPTDMPPPMLNTTYNTPGVLKNARLLGDETEIMETVYDLQTNANLANRFWVWQDGTMAAVATRGMQAPAFADRGTGYNYYDGAAWGPQPAARIETVRTGWPSIAPWGENGEIVVSHNFMVELVINHRETKGVGPWIEETYPGPGGDVKPSWARIVATGETNNYLHMIYNSYNAYQGQATAILYSRFDKDTQTWDIQDELLEGTGADFYTGINADDYVMASNGSTVIVLCASAWFDLFYMRSDDHGLTWEKHIIWEHPYPFFDFQTTLMDDTLYSVDNSANLAIDKNGMVHVVWGIGRVARLASAPPEPGFYSYWPFTDGIGYWNESMGQIPEAGNPHHTMMPEYLDGLGMLVGWAQGNILEYEGTGEWPFNVYRSLGISTMPTIMTHGSMIALAYACPTHEFVTTDGLYNYHHIWTRFSYDLGQTWGDFHDLQADNVFHLYDECIYPVFAPMANPDDIPQLIYQADNTPGLHLDEDHEPLVNRIIHNSFTFIVGIDEIAGNQVSQLSVSQNYPNPASGTTLVTVELNNAAFVSFDIFNMTGQKVFEIPARKMQAGAHNISFDVSGFSSGIYFYTITADNEKATHKMIVN